MDLDRSHFKQMRHFPFNRSLDIPNLKVHNSQQFCFSWSSPPFRGLNQDFHILKHTTQFPNLNIMYEKTNTKIKMMFVTRLDLRFIKHIALWILC